MMLHLDLLCFPTLKSCFFVQNQSAFAKSCFVLLKNSSWAFSAYWDSIRIWSLSYVCGLKFVLSHTRMALGDSYDRPGLIHISPCMRAACSHTRIGKDMIFSSPLDIRVLLWKAQGEPYAYGGDLGRNLFFFIWVF